MRTLLAPGSVSELTLTEPPGRRSTGSGSPRCTRRGRPARSPGHLEGVEHPAWRRAAECAAASHTPERSSTATESLTMRQRRSYGRPMRMSYLAAPLTSELRPVPGEAGPPLIGHTLHVMRDPLGWNRQFHDKYGPVAWTNLFGQRMVA